VGQGYWPDRLAILVRFQAGRRDLSFLHCVHTGFRTYPASCSVGVGQRFPEVWSGQDMKPTTYLSLIMRLRLNGAVRPLHLMLTWRVLGLLYRPLLANLDDAGLLTDRPVPCTLYVNRVYLLYSVLIKGWTVPDLVRTKGEESAFCFKFVTLNVTFTFKVKFLNM
jgi:hypothetical protein